MQKPLNVYLDTQDFINFSKHDVTPADQEIFESLLQRVENGDIVIGYSYPLLFEIIKRADSKFLADRQRKAELISTLCRRNSHPYYEDLSKGRRFPNEGVWAPMSTFDAISPPAIERRIEQVWIRVADRLNLSRAARKKIQSKSGRKSAVAGITLSPFSKADFPDIPVPQKFLDAQLFEKCMLGKCSANVVSNALKQWLYDPESLYELWYEYAGQKNPIDELKSRMESGTVSKLKLMRTAYLNVEDQKKEVRKARRAYHDAARSLRSYGLTVEGVVPMILEDFEIPLAEMELIFGVGRGAAAKIFIESLVFDGREVGESDWGDLLHFVYLPDVDLFRCDINMYNLMKRGQHPQAAKLVRSLNELPDRIDRALKLENQ